MIGCLFEEDSAWIPMFSSFSSLSLLLPAFFLGVYAAQNFFRVRTTFMFNEASSSDSLICL